MQNYTCFWHPRYGYGRAELDDPCEECGRRMDHPLTQLPERIGRYKVVAKISRGFYAATYVAVSDDFLARRVCLKVAPHAVYTMAGKDFQAECQVHLQVARGTRHLVNITDVIDDEVSFGSEDPIWCHVAVLDYVEGSSLDDLLSGETRMPAKRVAQVALDLLELLRELDSRQMNHNDLHAGNILIRELAQGDVRGGDQIDSAIEAVAVDLGSVQDGSKSGDASERLADAHQITDHLQRLTSTLHVDPDNADDIDYRLSRVLDDIAALLRPAQLAQRRTNFADLQDQVRATFELATSPWKEVPKGLTRISDSYNAQTMKSWFIPKLLVDPNGSWQKRVEAPGPLVVTGMRGCGKTMLLRALQFHARAVVAQEKNADDLDVLTALSQDGYVGLYASCNRLLDKLGRTDADIHEPISRLFLYYALQALQAIRHLEELSEGARATPRPIAETVSELITNSDDLRDIASVHLMERRIYTMLRSLDSGESTYILDSSPANAMTALATAVTQSARVWDGVSVYFLLDDVSTRHLHENSIVSLLSQLMFTSDVCAFKITTEAQTLELALKSPGLVERARPGRDYETFDLAQEILNSLRADSGRAGRDFVTRVLEKRRDLLATHPTVSPAELLGDKRLIDISREIASTEASSPRRKQVYAGLSALAAVCVGDIGDVLSIYQMIVDQAERSGRITEVPVAETVQSNAFQEHSARLIWRLNRRDGRLKDFADGFAQTAYQELRDSASRSRDARPRLREYNQIYVRVTSGDKAKQLRQLRELVDAGVFVLSGAPDAPRIKTRDGDPITQHILTFRKLLGLPKYVPLGQRDRFELSGDKLERWLEEPSESVTILRGSPRSDIAAAESELEETDFPGTEAAESAGIVSQPTLFDQADDFQGDDAGVSEVAVSRSPRTSEIVATDWDELREVGISSVLAGLGFEERAETSMQRITTELSVARADLVEYRLTGRARILDLLSGARTVRIPAVTSNWSQEPGEEGPYLIDITGLAKPFIYTAVRGQILRHGHAYIAYTAAEESYPLSEDVEKRLQDSAGDDVFARLYRFEDILTGEEGSYEFLRVGSGDVDDGRRRMLVAASSAKHERLFTLLDRREYDRVQIMIPADDAPRSRLAALAAEVASIDYHACEIKKVDTHDLTAMATAVEEAYSHRYLEENYNVEVGLTGSKLHAAALAIASADLKFAEAWYLRPGTYDPDRFTNGSGETLLYRVTRRQSTPGA